MRWNNGFFFTRASVDDVEFIVNIKSTSFYGHENDIETDKEKSQKTVG